jgi:hypothetical protein
MAVSTEGILTVVAIMVIIMAAFIMTGIPPLITTITAPVDATRIIAREREHRRRIAERIEVPSVLLTVRVEAQMLAPALLPAEKVPAGKV